MAKMSGAACAVPSRESASGSALSFGAQHLPRGHLRTARPACALQICASVGCGFRPAPGIHGACYGQPEAFFHPIIRANIICFCITEAGVLTTWGGNHSSWVRNEVQVLQAMGWVLF